MTLTVLDLFSGIGGFSYAAERLVGGFETKAFCEVDTACQAVLRKHWPDVPIFDDVCSLSANDLDFCPDVITAGFPCQDLSLAGKQAGYDGERSVLFYEIIRLARELRPKFLLLENVRNLLSHKNGETFQETLFQIAKAGYDAEWAVIPASDLGACHKRDRWWLVAYSCGEQSRCNMALPSGCWHNPWDEAALGYRCSSGSQQRIYGSSRHQPLSKDWRSYVSKPTIRGGDDGLSSRVDRYRVQRLKQLGNTIVPQVAAVPLTRIKQLAANGHAGHV